MPTPTDGPTTPLRKASPMTPTTPSSQTSTTIQSRRRCASNPLRIDAKAAQDIDSRENTPAEGGSKPGSSGDSSLPEQQHVSRPSRSRKPSTPTRSKQEPILLQRITPPVVPPVISLVPPEDVPSSSFRSVSTNQDIPDSPIPAAPVPTLPSAVDLHNMHMQRAKEEARKLLDSPVSPAVSSETGHSVGGWKNSPPYATVHGRPTGGVPGRNEFGYESVRSFTEERGGEKSWMLKQIDTIDSDLPVAAKTRSKLGGLFSRLKR
ncbi:hypothetical protein FRC19_007127 [Serendipita sp. 401]|nr:hypothetical protein FRC19_007127 [Serendipita sp. 401]